MTSIDLDFQGPFSWVESRALVFDQPITDEAGIYLWTISRPDGILVYYVGETGVSFRHRLQQHAQSYMSGYYRIWDPDQFALGKLELLWEGLWLKHTQKNFPNFIRDYQRYSTALYRLLGNMQLFLASTSVNATVRKCLGGSIVSQILTAPVAVSSFLDADKRHSKPSVMGDTCVASVISNTTILGLPKQFSFIVPVGE